MIFLERNVAMRVLIIYLMLLSSLSVFSVKPQQIIDSMVIKVAPWDAVTDIGIECSNFETSIDYPIKSNVSKNKTGAKANDSILVDKVWTERRTIFYSEEEMDSIGEGPMIEEGGIACGYAGCIKIEFLSIHRFRKVYPYGKVRLGSWYLKDDVLTMMYDKRERKEKKRYRFKIKYREKEECPTLYLFEINKIACYIFCNYK